MEAKYLEIRLGETICKRLKEIYHHEEPWSECYRKIADEFTELKKNMRKFYPEKDNVAIIKELITYSDEDIKDLFHMEQ